MKNNLIKVIESMVNKNGNITDMQEIFDWIQLLTESTKVNINECSIDDSTFWFYDEINGEILNRKRSFFSIKGVQEYMDGKLLYEQPIIIQPEIGYLGIICKNIDGVLNFLMQAKIEPGNKNGIQISPTIQATKSNFTRVHGGALPPYFEYFENGKKYITLVDQIQSEQASRFYGKRNRNMVIMVDDEIEVLPNYKWMTLGQIKNLMKVDNLVNMDTRTVLSCIAFSGTSFSQEERNYIESIVSDISWFHSLVDVESRKDILHVYQHINDYKMFHNGIRKLVPLSQITSWEVNNYGIQCNTVSDFEVKYYDIAIEGREVQKWTQPLFKAKGSATLGLLMCEINHVKKYLVCARPEIGAYDKIEIGPSIQIEYSHNLLDDNTVEKLFKSKLLKNEGIVADVVLSEEGGRFYHEQNRNVLMLIQQDELPELPSGYFWVNYCTLDMLIQINNCINIQLRNLLSLTEV